MKAAVYTPRRVRDSTRTVAMACVSPWRALKLNDLLCRTSILS